MTNIYELTDVKKLDCLQVEKYPATRYMGSKQKLLPYILAVTQKHEFSTVVDLFSGSGVVSYLFKCYGKNVVSNDYMNMSYIFTKAMIENNAITLDIQQAKGLLTTTEEVDNFVQTKFRDLYFSDQDNYLIDVLRYNIEKIDNEYQQAIAQAALVRACMKKRPRGIFTYVGHRYDDGRKDLQKTFEQQFLEAVQSINDAIFDNKKENRAYRGHALDFKDEIENALIYIDPPYYSQHSDNEYVRRYHFVEGLSLNWNGIEIQEHTKTKKFKSYPTPFSNRQETYLAFENLFKNFKEHKLLISYSSNCLPTLEEMIDLLKKYKTHIDVFLVDYKYSFANQKHKIEDNNNTVKEYLFLAY